MSGSGAWNLCAEHGAGASCPASCAARVNPGHLEVAPVELAAAVRPADGPATGQHRPAIGHRCPSCNRLMRPQRGRA